jgi:toxin ParE1/3/4
VSSKPIVPRELADQDVEEAIEYYLSEGAEQAALGFIAALEQAFTHVGRHAATGSARYD